MGATSQHIKEDDETQSQGKNIFSGIQFYRKKDNKKLKHCL